MTDDKPVAVKGHWFLIFKLGVMIHGKRYITVNSDARMSNLCTYAYWIKGDDFVFRKSGVFKARPIDITEAETMAILNALSSLRNRNRLNKVDIIVVNTDSKSAIHVLSFPREKVKKKYYRLRDFFEEYCSIVGLPIKFKHVKGHSKGKSAREFINNWCDREARKITK